MVEPWTVDGGSDRLARFVAKQASVSFNQAKRWVGEGKVMIDGQVVTKAGATLSVGQVVQLRMNAPRQRAAGRPRVEIVFEDDHVIVVNKPEGMSSVPYNEGERGTAMDAIRDAWKAQGKKSRGVPIHVVHRIDKATSGLLCFAKSKRAELGLARQLREHTMEREYRCVVHGRLKSGTIESELVRDRGDGMRWTARAGERGRRAVTHVELVEELKAASYCSVRLETGRTHQIRIHLASRGHPLVGDSVYLRDWRERREPIAATRLLLHARVLGFEHPISGQAVYQVCEPPPRFEAALAALRS